MHTKPMRASRAPHAFLASLVSLAVGLPAHADTAAGSESLEEIVITGSLIPQSSARPASALTVITADDMLVRGFTDVADALQQGSFSTGSVQGPQATNGFTQGAKTLAMFGLQPGYVKYLINGLPMSDYPALYNGTDTLTSIGGIPMALVERIDILPGGQSSLYGSDAIAGVVNVIMKKKMDGPEFSARVGYTEDGGGQSRTFSWGNGFDVGRMTVLMGAQYDHTNPIWGYQRPYTDRYVEQGSSPQTAERDYLVFGLFGRGPNGDGTDNYYFVDPQHCAGVSSGFGGTSTYRFRAGHGNYCGTTRSGFYTINNGDSSTQAYLRATLPLGASELYGDMLLSHDVTTFSAGGGRYDTTLTTSIYSYYLDPNLGDLMNLQHIFSPEEIGDLDTTLSDATTNMRRFVLGARGPLGGSWDYDLSATLNSQILIEHTFTQLTQPTLDFYAPLFGPDLGPDPYGFGVETFEPDYAAFYHPITPQQFASISGHFVNHSRTQDVMFRAQVTDKKLFALPGGDAGLALAAEGGHQLWSYDPDPGFNRGDFYGYTSSGASAGARNRYAFTGELRAPVLKALTLDLSGRYDYYDLKTQHFNKATFMLGAEYQLLDSLLLRARAGTAFKAPTLSDEFQGQSGFYVGATDYYLCAVNNIPVANCQIPSSGYAFGTTGGNPALQPINADVWSAGLTWHPAHSLSFDVDYLHWKIRDEVATQTVDQVLRIESACRLGQLDANSPSCVQALAQVTRDPGTNQITQVDTPKINVSRETLDALTVAAHYEFRTARLGNFAFAASWTDMLKHELEQFPGDPVLDLLNYPFYFPNGTDFKTKANASVTWTRGPWSSTVYVNNVGRSPNYAAGLFPEGYATPGAADLPPWTLCNFELGYQLTPRLQAIATVTNVFNTMPPVDHSWPGIYSQPFNIFNYNNYGTAYRLEVRYGMGGH